MMPTCVESSGSVPGSTNCSMKNPSVKLAASPAPSAAKIPTTASA
jgi:hypothetical protein